jgi:Ni/Fe-hydrogenase subunit HybB-like protein
MGMTVLTTKRSSHLLEQRDLVLRFTIGLLAVLVAVGVVAGIWRLAAGLGTSTALTDNVPWGIWIGFDFSLIAFSGAAFTMAGLVYILRRQEFRPALRPAVLTGLLGYVGVLALLVLDLGRPDRFYHFMIFWNVHSPLFEICWCILLYTVVLTVEVSPQILEKMHREKLAHRIHSVIVPVAIAAVTLSSLHQSTLGTLYLNMPHRLHALWFTPILPALFFVSAVMVGLSMGALGYRLATSLRGVVREDRVFRGLAHDAGWVAIAYLVLKFGDWMLAGELGALFRFDHMSRVMWVEIGLLILGVVLLQAPRLRNHDGPLTLGLGLLALAALVNRFSATLFAQIAPDVAAYTPHIAEWLSTIGVVAAALLAWLLAVRYLAVFEPKAHAHKPTRTGAELTKAS